MADESEARVYGMADQANRHPPAAEGMRGVQSSTDPRRRDPELSHKVTLDTGNTVTVSEGSGVAFAESTGRAGLSEPKPWLEPAPEEESSSSTATLLPLITGLAAAVAIIAFTTWRMSGRRAEIDFEPAPELDL